MNLLIICLCWFSFATAALFSNHVLHEKRDMIPSGWMNVGKPASHVTLPVRIALKQSNLKNGHDLLMDISHPHSQNYGRHLTAQEIMEMFSPSQVAVDGVTSWLIAAGIPESSITRSFGGDWIEVNMTVTDVQVLLQAEYDVYQHETGPFHVACAAYSLPESVQPHIDFITPTVHFDTRAKRSKNIKRTTSPLIGSSKAHRLGQPGSGSLPKVYENASKPAFSNSSASDLSSCDENMTVHCLHALYSFDFGTRSNPRNSYGIVEYGPQAYLGADLDAFFEMFYPEMVGQRPVLDSIDGGVLQTIVESFDYDAESDVDLEYAMALVYPQQITLYQVGDLVEGATFNNFLDALDKSYCTGDDPSVDATYPDSTNSTLAYKGVEDCGTYAPTKVISTSYGDNENDLTAAYEIRQCHEYMKLGLLGVTVLFASGDCGVASNEDTCIDPETGDWNDGDSGRFVLSFPATCPYVTAVGATQMAPGASVTQPEIAADTVVYSGGGFSNVFAIPDYQKSAVGEYYKKYAPSYTAEQYNNSQNVRGVPDVSANGAWFVTNVNGEWDSIFGTSCSTPVFGSIIALINEERLNAGKAPVGFINPTIYEYREMFNDITNGTNPGCGTEGFLAVPGWDPVTGLGTPNYPKMLEVFMSLA